MQLKNEVVVLVVVVIIIIASGHSYYVRNFEWNRICEKNSQKHKKTKRKDFPPSIEMHMIN